MKRIILFLTTLTLLVPIASVSAHRPLWGEQFGLIEIPDLNTSFALYRDLNAGQIDVYTFEGSVGQDFHAGIQIPMLAGLEEYGVSVALFGPGLPLVDTDSLPSEYPEDLGALVYPSVVTEDFFEPFTQTNYWGRQQIDLALPADGDYYLLVWHPEGQPGKYVLDTGRAEVFGALDLFRFPIWWLRVHMYFGHGPQLALVSGLLLSSAVFVIVRKREPADSA